MISVSSDMIFRAVVFSLLLGLLNGSVYIIFRLISALFRSGIRHALKRDKSTKRAREYSNIFDFVFTFSVGIEYILLIYAFTDGVIYFVSLLTLLMGFFASKTVLSKIFTRNKSIKR